VRGRLFMVCRLAGAAHAANQEGAGGFRGTRTLTIIIKRHVVSIINSKKDMIFFVINAKKDMSFKPPILTRLLIKLRKTDTLTTTLTT
jgi:hypothetical protein